MKEEEATTHLTIIVPHKIIMRLHTPTHTDPPRKATSTIRERETSQKGPKIRHPATPTMKDPTKVDPPIMETVHKSRLTTEGVLPLLINHPRKDIKASTILINMMAE